MTDVLEAYTPGRGRKGLAFPRHLLVFRAASWEVQRQEAPTATWRSRRGRNGAGATGDVMGFLRPAREGRGTQTAGAAPEEVPRLEEA